MTAMARQLSNKSGVRWVWGREERFADSPLVLLTPTFYALVSVSSHRSVDHGNHGIPGPAYDFHLMSIGSFEIRLLKSASRFPCC